MRIPCVFFALLLSGTSWGQVVPVGPEFQVNTYSTSSQYRSSVASDGAGNFVVVWNSYTQDGSGTGIFGQRYDSAGTPTGPEFQVNTYTTDRQQRSAVASDSAGNFVVVWASYTQDGDLEGIFGQRYDIAGAPTGPEFQVNTYTTSSQLSPSVASDGAGNFVVVWQSYTQDGDSTGVFGQRYDSTGAPTGPEFQVNTYTTSFQVAASVAFDGAGNFVVVWHSRFQDGDGWGVFGQLYDSAGTPLGAEFQVNTYTTDSQASPSVASDGAGNFVVVWSSYGQDGDTYGVFGQRYDSSGTPLEPEFQVNTNTTGTQQVPAVASDSAGNFVVVWASRPQDGDGDGIFGQRYDSSGTPLEPEFQVNTYTTSLQRRPAVASDSAGNFVVVWASRRQDGDGDGIFGQRFTIPRAPLLRNDEVTSLNPVTPPLSTILPLDPGLPPAGDRYLDDFASGDVDPTPSPGLLVFYGLDSPDTLRLAKTSGGSIRILF